MNTPEVSEPLSNEANGFTLIFESHAAAAESPCPNSTAWLELIVILAARVEPSAAKTPITVIPRMTRNPFRCFKGAREEPSNFNISIFVFLICQLFANNCETGSPLRLVYRTTFHGTIQQDL
jgi:hypothetical protein